MIERNGRPGVKLVPVAACALAGKRRVGGQNLLGVTYIASDFNAPMSVEDLKEWGY